MKALNEVIKAYEWCLDDAHDECDGCPYYEGRETDCHDRNVDALFYLREYVTKQESIHRKEIRLDKAIESYEPTKQIEQLEKMLDEEMDLNAELLSNPELTWDELKEMQGKPIWLEANHDFITHDGWAICGFVPDYKAEFVVSVLEDNFHTTEFGLLRSYYGKTWKAYRKERIH